MSIRTYGCRMKWRDLTYEQEYSAESAGKARYRFLQDIQEVYPDATFADVRVRTFPRSHEPHGFRHNAEYRGVPFVRIGMRVNVGGDDGCIVGHNSSANLNVLFTSGKWKGQTLNCHPHSGIIYFGDDGKMIAGYDAKCQPVTPENTNA